MSATLLTIVEVHWDQRIRCQAPGCGKAVYKRIHVVREDDRVVVVGSDCWSRIYAGSPGVSSKPSLGGYQGRLLSPEEREQLLANTAAFVARIEREASAAAAIAEKERIRREKEKRDAVEREPRGWHPPQMDTEDPPYVSPEDRQGRRHSPQEALAKFREQEARRVARELRARVPAFRPFPERWVARAMRRAKDDLVASGLKLDEPGSRQRIEASALALLEHHYSP